MPFDWIYLIPILLFLCFIIVFAWASYVIVRFCNRWTQNLRNKKLYDILIFIGSFFLISVMSFFIFILAFPFQR